MPTSSISNKKFLCVLCRSFIFSFLVGLVPSIGSTEPKCFHLPSRVDKSNSVMLLPPLKIQSYKSNKVLLLRSFVLLQEHQVWLMILRTDLFEMHVLQMRVV